MQSIVQARGQVTFPAFAKERHYMRAFTQAEGLPQDLRHWQETVDQMLAGIEAPGPIYLMVDQSVVQSGQPQRRPGMHIDGYWNPGTASHDQDPRHIVKASGLMASWPAEAIILASDVQACRALQGAWDGVIGEGGDCSTLALGHLASVRLEPYTAYAGNVTMLHESMPVTETCERTLVRLNVPGWTPN